jgi:hypothetical protein
MLKVLSWYIAKSFHKIREIGRILRPAKVKMQPYEHGFKKADGKIFNLK